MAGFPPTACASGKKRGEMVQKAPQEWSRHCSADEGSEAVASVPWGRRPARGSQPGCGAGLGRSLQATRHRAEGGSCGAARPERCAEPQPLSGTCHAQGQGGGPSWSRSTPPPSSLRWSWHPLPCRGPCVLTATLGRASDGLSRGKEQGAWSGAWRAGRRKSPAQPARSPSGQRLGWWRPRDTGPVAEARALRGGLRKSPQRRP